MNSLFSQRFCCWISFVESVTKLHLNRSYQDLSFFKINWHLQGEVSLFKPSQWRWTVIAFDESLFLLKGLLLAVHMPQMAEDQVSVYSKLFLCFDVQLPFHKCFGLHLLVPDNFHLIFMHACDMVKHLSILYEKLSLTAIVVQERSISYRHMIYHL